MDSPEGRDPLERMSDIPPTEGLRITRLEVVWDRMVARLKLMEETAKKLSTALGKESRKRVKIQKILDEEVEPYAKETRRQVNRLKVWVFRILVFLVGAFTGLGTAGVLPKLVGK